MAAIYVGWVDPPEVGNTNKGPLPNLLLPLTIKFQLIFPQLGLYLMINFFEPSLSSF
jgi:hypothetical protein